MKKKTKERLAEAELRLSILEGQVGLCFRGPLGDDGDAAKYVRVASPERNPGVQQGSLLIGAPHWRDAIKADGSTAFVVTSTTHDANA